MKKHWVQLSFIGLALLMAASIKAQVQGISYTLSPSGEYVFWSKEAGLSDNFLVGGQLGFGFGQFVVVQPPIHR